MTHPVYVCDCQKYKVEDGSIGHQALSHEGALEHHRIGNEVIGFPVSADDQGVLVIMPDCEVVVEGTDMFIMVPTEHSFPGDDKYNELKRATVRMWQSLSLPEWVSLVSGVHNPATEECEPPADEDIPF